MLVKTKKLSSIVKNCAKEIVDFIYDLDQFDRIRVLFENTGKNIKVNTKVMEGDISTGDFLRFMFALPDSSLYNRNSNDKKNRTFDDKEYEVKINGEILKCRLTTEWKGAEIAKEKDGNFLGALILIVNKYYKNLVEIKKESGEYYLYMNKTFKLSNLPSIFTNDFSRRYITSLLAKPFVILTGNSGTGKTRIAKQFAEYLEVDMEEGRKNWIIVPVGADWTDNTKILGFYNPLADGGSGKYEKTRIIELIEEANRNRNIPYFIILDEMNLSHVERYFSDFLSNMEMSDSLFVLDGYEGRLEFTDNLFVVGTVNIDETTYMFSPKVLDRANVVEFKPEKEKVLELFTNSACDEKIEPANDGTAEVFLELSKNIRQGIRGVDNAERNANEQDAVFCMEDIKGVFGMVYDALEKGRFEFAYRTVREIRQYINAAYEISDADYKFDLIQAMDEQLIQKVLPKIHGNRKEIGQLLDQLEKICMQEEINFKLSVKKIEQMKGKLASVQYASFI